MEYEKDYTSALKPEGLHYFIFCVHTIFFFTEDNGRYFFVLS